MLGIAVGVVLAFFGGIAWWLNVVLVALVLFVANARLTVSCALIAAHGIRIAEVVRDNVRIVPEWDFRVFWLHAQLAARGYDFYDRALVSGFLRAMHASPRFVDLGRFWNPPQAMLLLLPLGWIDNLHVAYAVWYAVQIAALAAALLLLVREYGESPVALAALLLAMYATLAMFVVGQSHGLVLLLLIGAWRARRNAGGGALLALAAVLKPLALVLLIDTLLRKRWRMLAGFAAALAALTLASIALFGLDVNLRYVARGAGALPRQLLIQPPNRSLLAAVLRAGLPEWLFVICAIAIVAVAALIVRRNEATALAALLSAALLVYPQTLDHYAILLIIPIASLWKESTAGALAALAVHTFAAPVPGVFDSPNVALAATISLVACAVTSARAHVSIITAA